jgi:hypothetical protein
MVTSSSLSLSSLFSSGILINLPDKVKQGQILPSLHFILALSSPPLPARLLTVFFSNL